MAKMTAGDPPVFHFVMIKPTHCDDDGYPIQSFRSAIPSNTLACLNALAEEPPLFVAYPRISSRLDEGSLIM